MKPRRTYLTWLPLPPHQGEVTGEIAERFNANHEQVRAAAVCVSHAIAGAWGCRPEDQRSLTKAQYTQLVLHLYYPQILDAAFARPFVGDVAVVVRRLVAELDA
ncbi:hypothetical protein [Streptomyces sp. H51]|uniref:hypothetical protein n=1 Tax=Streptomyces sp. H51 TaxID=3111770 RepID=UPI002D798DC9|nr:hypothetical protein [Streptomyces sp. H51]